MRFGVATVAAVAALVVVVVGGAGCEGTGGAVSVRWHIVDLTDGQLTDPGDVGKPDGTCAGPPGASPPLWTIDRIELVIANPLTGIAEPPPCFDMGCESFKCSQTEATTPFTLPLGTFALSLRATSPPTTETVTPAPAVRTIRRAEVVNLDVVEIGVRPLPLAVFDGGESPPDLAVPDAGL